MEYWQKDIETMNREDLEKLQLERLKKTIEAAGNSPFYNKVFKENGITADSIQSLDDLQKIPFTTKDDLRNNYPYGMAAIPIKDCVRIHSSSGTTGNPTVVLHSAKDLDQWANQVARCMYMVGIRDTDVFQNTSGYGMFTRRIRVSIRSRKIRLPDRTGSSRKYQTADQVHHGFRDDLPPHHSQLCHPSGGSDV